MPVQRRTSSTGGSSASSTSWSATRPAAAVDGDVAYWCCDFTGGPGTITTPTGWTKLGTYTITMANPQMHVFRRVLDGTSDDSPAMTIGTARPMAWVMVVYSGELAAAPEDGSVLYQESGATTVANPVTSMPATSTPGAMMVGFGGVSATTSADWTAISTMSLFTSVTGVQSISAWDRTADIAGTQPDVTWTMTSARRYGWLAWSITPAPDKVATLDAFGLEILPRTWL